MKKNIFFLVFLFGLLALVSCESDHGYRKLIWSKVNDTIEFKVYAGSPQGGVEVFPWKNTKYKNIDSLKNIYFKRHLDSIYKPALYEKMSVEFLDTKVAYSDSADINQSKTVISDYAFRKDSLFVINLTGKIKQKFVALGTDTELYRLKGVCSFLKSGKTRYTFKEKNDLYTLSQVLTQAGYDKIESMTNKGDTIIWANVKYIFK